MSKSLSASAAVVLSVATGAAITAASQSMTSTNKATTKALDAMHADGVRGFMLRAATKDEAVFDAVLGFVIKGFDADAQKLLTVDIKSLNDTQKATRRLLRQEAGSRVGKFASLLDKREKSGSANNGPNLWSVRIRREIEALKDGLKKAKPGNLLDVDVVDTIAALDDVLATL